MTYMTEPVFISVYSVTLCFQRHTYCFARAAYVLFSYWAAKYDVLTIMQACGPEIDSVSIVTEVEFDLWLELNRECNSEIFIQEL